MAIDSKKLQKCLQRDIGFVRDVFSKPSDSSETKAYREGQLNALQTVLKLVKSWKNEDWKE